MAAAAGIPTYCFDRKDFPNLAQQKSAIFDKARELKPDFVALAGFMLLAQEEFVNHFSGRMINIHPALLPAYAGLNTHRRVLEAGEKKHGCSVHFVDCGVDTGALIAQAALDVIPGESESELASRVLTLEHKLYPWVANNLASGEIKLTNNLVSFADNLRLQATKLGFTLGDSI